jgi:hypothetical protein
MSLPYAMKRSPFGATAMQVGAIGFGAAQIGFEPISDSIVDKMLGMALDAGINVIDSAAMYGDSEEKIGRILGSRRHHVLLFTKCGLCPPSRRSLKGFSLGLRHGLRRYSGSAHKMQSQEWDPRALEWNIEQSLRKLNTDYIDLIQLHSCSEETLRRGEAIEVLQRARAAGKVRYLGYSSDGRASDYAIRCGQFDAIQIAINIADQGPLDETIPLAAQHGMGIVVKRPMANGLWQLSSKPDFIHNQAYWERLRKLAYAFLRSDRAFEIALRFTLSVPSVHTALIGTTNPAHMLQNIANAISGPLDRKGFEEIRARWKEAAEPDWINQV